MTVDLSKAKAGDTVKFRCGGEAVIAKITNGPTFEFKGYDLGNWEYEIDGSWGGGRKSNYPFDIIAIEPAPFDWATVKPGMAFSYGGKICRFIGWHPESKNSPVVTKECHGSLTVYSTGVFTRAPEHDIEVLS